MQTWNEYQNLVEKHESQRIPHLYHFQKQCLPQGWIFTDFQLLCNLVTHYPNFFCIFKKISISLKIYDPKY